MALIALICFAGGSSGCSWTATVGRTDTLDSEAEIDHSDADALYLLARSGGIHRIPRHSVRSIDHPGNVEMIVGALLIGFGAAIAIDEWDKNSSDAKGIAVIYGVPGLTLLMLGAVRYFTSLRAAWAFQTADAPLGEPWAGPAAAPTARGLPAARAVPAGVAAARATTAARAGPTRRATPGGPARLNCGHDARRRRASRQPSGFRARTRHQGRPPRHRGRRTGGARRERPRAAAVRARAGGAGRVHVDHLADVRGPQAMDAGAGAGGPAPL